MNFSFEHKFKRGQNGKWTDEVTEVISLGRGDFQSR